ncbi:MAG: hypothetical protein Q7S61_00300 [bacterium]|nr:hypothetical protein [bacterium]
MMVSYKKPHLIFAKLIDQPTWGGDYILKLKNLQTHPSFQDKKIGQSYELFGDSKLALEITDSSDARFIPEVGYPDKPDVHGELFPFHKDIDYLTLSELVGINPSQMLGEKVQAKWGKMPLLIKLNHAAGNSFQLHIKPSQTHLRWQPKPESWYYLEDGLVTYGIKKDADIDEYKKTCVEIDSFMKTISLQVQQGTMTLEEANRKAKEFIREKNPWQYVNKHVVHQYELVDLSSGGIHHSWEEDKENFPQGNILLEVQQDVMDPFCTIRSFDQGKIKSDGTIRPLNIDDYFRIIDTDPAVNDFQTALKKRQGNRLLTTPYYCLDIIEVKDKVEETIKDSFAHLYVRNGEVEVTTDEGNVRVGKGHSCFVPYGAEKYTIKALQPNSVVLKTYIVDGSK